MRIFRAVVVLAVVATGAVAVDLRSPGPSGVRRVQRDQQGRLVDERSGSRAAHVEYDGTSAKVTRGRFGGVSGIRYPIGGQRTTYRRDVEGRLVGFEDATGTTTLSRNE